MVPKKNLKKRPNSEDSGTVAFRWKWRAGRAKQRQSAAEARGSSGHGGACMTGDLGQQQDAAGRGGRRVTHAREGRSGQQRAWPLRCILSL